MIITLNQILKLMKDFQTNHPMIRDFGYGETSDIGTSRHMEFPYLWVTHENDSQIEITNKVMIPIINFTLLFCDRVNIQENYLEENGENSNNGQEILSDSFQLAQDLVTTVLSSWGQWGISFNDNPSLFNVVDETDDKVNGWGLRISLRLKHHNCQIPI